MKKQLSHVLLLLGLAFASAYPRTDEVFADVTDPQVRDVVPVFGQQSKQTVNVGPTYQDDNVVEPKVSYAGAQLWQVAAENDKKKIVLGRLRENKGKCPVFTFVYIYKIESKYILFYIKLSS